MVSRRFDTLLAQLDGLAGGGVGWREVGGVKGGGGLLRRSFVFFAIDSSAFLLLSCIPYIFGILTLYQIIICKYFLLFWFFKAIHCFLDYA